MNSRYELVYGGAEVSSPTSGFIDSVPNVLAVSQISLMSKLPPQVPYRYTCRHARGGDGCAREEYRPTVFTPPALIADEFDFLNCIKQGSHGRQFYAAAG